MRLSISGACDDELRSLQAWLVAEEDLRGRVDVIHRPPEVGQLGGTLDGIVIATPFAGIIGHVLIAWLKSRVGTIKLDLRGADGSHLSLSSTQVAGLDVTSLAELIARIDGLDLGARPVVADADSDGPTGVEGPGVSDVG